MPKAATKTVATRTKTPSAKKRVQTTPRRVAEGSVIPAASSVAVDSSQWRASRVRVDAKIAKSYAIAQYRLKAHDFVGLSFQRKSTVKNGRVTDMHLYNERDVERRAWERHGGPAAFDAYIANLRERYIKKHKSDKSFVQPSSYENPGPSVSMIMPTTQTGFVPVDPSIGSSAILHRIKHDMPEWLWTAFNKALDWVNAINCSSPFPPFGSPGQREVPMCLALRVANTYPPRPVQLLPSSPSVDALRAVLADAAHAPDGKHGVTDLAGIEWDEDEEGVGSYDWSYDYHERLFAALVAVIQAHGTGDEGWRTIRWEVYDKYRECFELSITYSETYRHESAEWADAAAHWLDGRYMHDGLLHGMCRGQSPLGMQYNGLLPLLHAHGCPQVGHLP